MSVSTLHNVTKKPLPVERVLTNEDALALTEVLVVGWNPDGSLYLAASDADMARGLMLLARAQRELLDLSAAS